jgi:hypothetical protein
VTPKNAQTTGFAVSCAAQDDGMVRVTIIRDLAKEKSFPADSPNELRRNAELRVYGDMACSLAAELKAALPTKELPTGSKSPRSSYITAVSLFVNSWLKKIQMAHCNRIPNR